MDKLLRLEMLLQDFLEVVNEDDSMSELQDEYQSDLIWAISFVQEMQNDARAEKFRA